MPQKIDIRYIILFTITSLVVVLDQITKLWVIYNIPEYKTITVILGFFNLVNIRNRGAAFGFLNRPDIEWQFWLFLVATIIAVITIIYLIKTSKYSVLFVSALSLILGGALGNFIDRIRFRAVVDFLDFYVGIWHWPAFNVADICICVGAVLACLYMYNNPKISERV